MSSEFICKSENELGQIASELIESYKNRKVFAFFGKLGSGKTTFIKAICKFLGSNDVVTSPSFNIINIYNINQNDKIFHFDFYRITKENEAYDIGYEEYFYSENYCFIEWPEKIETLLPPDVVKIEISVEKNNIKRKIIFKP